MAAAGNAMPAAANVGPARNDPPAGNNGAAGAPPIVVQQNPLVNVRDRLFHAMFYRIALTYARAFPKPVRRIIEFAILIKVRIFCYKPFWLSRTIII